MKNMLVETRFFCFTRVNSILVVVELLLQKVEANSNNVLLEITCPVKFLSTDTLTMVVRDEESLSNFVAFVQNKLMNELKFYITKHLKGSKGIKTEPNLPLKKSDIRNIYYC